MSGSAVQTWLALKQRQALRSSGFYFLATATVGIFALLPIGGFGFIISKILLLIAVPMAAHQDLWASLLTVPLVFLLFADCLHAERDDWAIIPLWLAREFFHMGPRLIFDGWQHIARARQFVRIDNAACAEVLAYLVTKTTPTSREELLRVFPNLAWDEIVWQLRAIDGVILFRNVKSVSLLAPLRRELRQWLANVPEAEIPPEEPAAIPVEAPPELSAHEILGVSENASTAEIKTAYHNRVKECHPDCFPHLDAQSRELAEEWTKAINAAYAKLRMGRRTG